MAPADGFLLSWAFDLLGKAVTIMKKMIPMLFICLLLLFAGCAAGKGNEGREPGGTVVEDRSMDAVNLVLENIDLDVLDYNAVISGGMDSIDNVQYYVVTAGVDNDDQFTETARYYVDIGCTAVYQLDTAANTLTRLWVAETDTEASQE